MTTEQAVTAPEGLDKLSPTQQKALAECVHYRHRSVERNDGPILPQTFDALRSRGLIETETQRNRYGQPTYRHSLTDEAVAIGRYVLENGPVVRTVPITRGAAKQILDFLRAELVASVERYPGHARGLSEYCAMFTAETIAERCSLKLSTARSALRRLDQAKRLRRDRCYTGWGKCGARFTRAQFDQCRARDAVAKERQDRILDALRERGIKFSQSYDYADDVKVSVEAIGELLGITD